MRVYELVFIVKPDLPEEETQAEIDQVKAHLAEGGAAIDKEDVWGKRRLAYRVRGYLDGHYVLIQYSAADGSSLPREIERRLRVADNIIKFMTIRLDEDLKRIEKLKQRREKRSARAPRSSPRSAAPKPAAPRAPGKPAAPEGPAAPKVPAAEAEPAAQEGPAAPEAPAAS